MCYRCSCPDGYFYQGPPAATGCLDIEECKTNNGGCEHECNEKNMDDDSMMYQCACRPGFKLNINQHACDGKRHHHIQLVVTVIALM